MTATPSPRAESPEAVLGVDIFLMPDGYYYLREDAARYYHRETEALQRDSPDNIAPMRAQNRVLYRNLLAAALEQPTPCRGDERFTADPGTLSPADLADLRRMCDGCHALGRCRMYARYGKPEAGYWAGQDRSPRTAAQLRAAALPRALRNRPAIRQTDGSPERRPT